MSEEQRIRVLHDWRIWGRPKQIFDPSNPMTVVTSGRGWGKTNAGAEHCHRMADEWQSKCGGILGIAGRTYDDAVKDLIEGKAGILATQKPWNRCTMRNRAIYWENGSMAYILTGDKPSKFRGKNLGFLWGDEFAHWKYPRECYEAFSMDVRNGESPSILLTSTPLPEETFIKIVSDPDTIRIIGHTSENAANIDKKTLASWIRKFEGTEVGLQELGGEILSGSRHACWRQEWIQRMETYEMPALSRVVVGIDPAGRKNKNSDETGIVVAGIDDLDNSYVLDDATDKYSPTEWAAKAIYMARYHGAQRIVGETNYGGDMVMTIIRQHPDWPQAAAEGVELVEVTATESKGNRALPVAALYEQRRCWHVGEPRKFAVLEYEMTHFDPTVARGRQKSPNSMDALVHAMADLHPDREGLGASSEMDAAVTEDWIKMLGSLHAHP